MQGDKKQKISFSYAQNANVQSQQPSVPVGLPVPQTLNTKAQKPVIIPAVNVASNINQSKINFLPAQQAVYQQPVQIPPQSNSYAYQNGQQAPVYQTDFIPPNQMMNNVQVIQPMMYGNHMHYGQEHYIKLLKPKEKDKKIAAIIVSFCNSSTYDDLFTHVQQKTMQGSQVLVYACAAHSVKDFNKAFEEPPTDQILKEFIQDLKEVQPDCVVFNWQCSAGYSGKTFIEGKQIVFSFLKKIIQAGHMAMFSDFSLKALINQWDSEVLGSNPFLQTGQTSNPVQLKFKPGVLKQCPSAQLQLVGDLAEGGQCHISVLGGTILYSVDTNKIDHHKYALEILTINKTDIPQDAKLKLKIDGVEGSAGHVLLRYKSGGLLLTSMGHWVELMKIDTSEQKLFEIAQREYGIEKASQMRNQYASMDVGQQRAYISSNAVQFVQNQAPCANMSKKAYSKGMSKY